MSNPKATDTPVAIKPGSMNEWFNRYLPMRVVPVLKLVAWYSYRVKLNGTFVAFGPARGPKGFFRPDELDLAKAAKPGRNDLVVEVAGYNVPNFYLMEQAPFFKAEVVVDGKVRTASRATGSDFSAIRLPRVQKVPRYTFQRTFAEVYRLPAAANPPALPLAKAPEPVLIERRAPYPDYEENPRMVPVSFAAKASVLTVTTAVSILTIAVITSVLAVAAAIVS